MFPEHQVLYEGGTAIISCESLAKPYWTKNNRILYNDSVLVLNNVTARDMGNYLCHGNYFNKTEFVSKSEVLVGSR